MENNNVIIIKEKYKILEQINQGAFGITYKCLDLNQDNNANDVKMNTDEVKKDIECSLTSIDSVQSNLLTDISVNENKKNYVSDKQKLFEVETKQESNGKLKRELSTFSFE